MFTAVTLSPVFVTTSLTIHKIFRSENLTKRPRLDRGLSAGFKNHKDGTGSVVSTGFFIVVDIYFLKLKTGVTSVGTRWHNTMLIRDGLPELQTKKVPKMNYEVHQSRHS
jgi:hypothetical protein